ncbi:MAG: hypothetical protein J2P55_00945 [Rhizobiales bacterium]|nr:hypothetical protein [Hyphomicrobiales bacterium]
MTDYHPLITRAVEGLGNNTAEARRTMYERARAALVAQLRGLDPPLSEAEITRERLALEDAIRKVEAESVRKARTEPRPGPVTPRAINAQNRQSMGGAVSATPGAAAWRDRQSGTPGDAAPLRAEGKFSDLPRREPPQASANKTASSESPRPAEPPTSARSRLLSARISERPPQDLKMFRKPIAATDDLDMAPQATAPSRDAHNDYRGGKRREFSDEREATWDHAERADYEESPDLIEDGSAPMHEQAYDLDDEQRIEPGRPRRALEPIDHYREPRPPRSYRGLARLIVAVLIIVGVSSLVYWQWSNINSVYQFLSHMRSRQSQTAQQPAGEPKFPGRVPQEQTRPQPPAAGSKSQSGPAVAQRVVLYEEDPGNPQGKQYVGSAVWRTETVSPGSGLAPELQIRADVTIPERNMTVTWSLRRNTDQALPASHTIEIMFNLPPDFPGGGISNVPGVLMKESEQARGVPLAGLAVKVTNGFFLIGLSAVDADVQRNLQLLKERPWFDVPVVYNNGGRAILALEKGPSGDRAFADAFAAWGK